MYMWLILFLCFTVGGSFACLAATLVPSFTIGVSVVIVCSFGLFLVAGYFQNRHELPSYWLWLHYLSHFKYPYEAILIQQLEWIPCVRSLLQEGLFIENGAEVLEQQGIEPMSKGIFVGIMIAFAVVYRVLFYIVLQIRLAARAF